MTRIPRIDWEDLGFALTFRVDEGGHFLDRTTGEVVTWTGGEDPVLSEEDLDAALAAGRLLQIDPLPSSLEYQWMEMFIEAITDGRVRRRLQDAVSGPKPFRRFKDVLAAYPSERERWFAFHNERVREAAREWLDENGIEVEHLDDE